MESIRGSLLGLVYARACEFAIAFNGQDERVPAGRYSGKRGLPHQVNRGLLWLFDYSTKLLRALNQPIVNLTDYCIPIFKVRFEGERSVPIGHWDSPAEDFT